MRNLNVFLLLFALPGVNLFAQTLIPFGSEWKYLDNGSNQGVAWTSLSFDDSNWKIGKAELGYGSGSESTVINFGPNPKKKYITTYIRKTVYSNDPSLYSSFTVDVKRDDGVVVYLNGVEVYRDNMPSGAISYNTFATAANNNRKSIKSFTTGSELIIKGANVIAVEIHQYSHSSADMSFDMQVTGHVSPGNSTLVSFGSDWKYLDDGSDQGALWTSLSYADDEWKIGAAILGYGNRNERTVVSYGPDPEHKYITTYFRKTISLSNPNEFKKYRFTVKRDDGIVVYLNGKEVYRNNMPTGDISYTTLALGSVDENALLKSFDIDASVFITGINVIAVEIHQANPTSTDISFDLNFAGAPDSPEKIRVIDGPTITRLDQSEVTIQWKTNLATDTKFETGTTYGHYTESVSDAGISTTHEVRLGGLLPDTKYFYRLGSTSEYFLGSLTDFFITNSAGANLSVKPGIPLTQADRTLKEISDFNMDKGQNNIQIWPTLVPRGKLITIRLNVDQPVEATVVNINGNFIRSLKVSKITSLETNDLPSGAYVIITKSNKNVSANRFVVIN